MGLFLFWQPLAPFPKPASGRLSEVVVRLNVQKVWHETRKNTDVRKAGRNDTVTKPMQLAAHVLAYNVNRFIGPVLRNIAPHVDKVFVAYAEKPFGYRPEARQRFQNPTRKEDIAAAGLGKKVEIIEGDWLTEEAMRNACLDRAQAEGFDWLLTQDADEFYAEKSWDQILKALERNSAEDCLTTTWYNFWKSSHYVLVSRNGEIKESNAGFAIRCRSDLKFVRQRIANASRSRVIDCPCHHYGYVMSDEELLEKLLTWSHASQLNAKRWFRIKWVNWRESTRYLHPIYPMHWEKAIRFPLQQPDFADQFALPINTVSNVSFREGAVELWFDWFSKAKDLGGRGKRVLGRWSRRNAVKL